MEKRKIGNTDLEASVVGFGCWPLSGAKDWTNATDKDSIEAVETAIDCGVNFFDVAPVYGLGHAEEILGKALKGKRDSAIIASKCGLVWDENNKVSHSLTRESIKKEIEDSLRRLKTDYIDLYQIHWPDPITPIEETMLALNEIQREGKIRHIGVTNFSIELLEEAKKYSEIVSQQCLYNMLEKNAPKYHKIDLQYRVLDEMLPFCEENNIAFLPYSPLQQGVLAGVFNKENNFSSNDVRRNNFVIQGEQLEKNLEIVSKLQVIADEIGKPLSQIAINWLIADKRITSVICGSQNTKQAKENSLSGTWQLDSSTLEQINNILDQYEV